VLINPKAIKFRKFWGEKAELRRFKDGAIAESTGKCCIFVVTACERDTPVE
jgi:hypothetical protein